MTKQYYVLLIFTNNRWYPEFGDYDRSTVLSERDDYRREYKASHLKVLAVKDDTQEATDCAVSALNKAKRVAA
jgi:hypothetical protein